MTDRDADGFEKEVVQMPEGRELIYYRFPESAPPGAPPAPPPADAPAPPPSRDR
jgi:hypothetical protein